MDKKIIWAITIILILGVIGGILFYSRDKDKNHFISLSGEEFKEKINNKDSFILLLIQTGCHFCEEFKPIVNEVIKENDGLKIYALNLTDMSTEEKAFLVNIANTTSTPTMIFIVNGEEETSLNRMIGKVSKSKLITRLESLGYIK